MTWCQHFQLSIPITGQEICCYRCRCIDSGYVLWGCGIVTIDIMALVPHECNIFMCCWKRTQLHQESLLLQVCVLQELKKELRHMIQKAQRSQLCCFLQSPWQSQVRQRGSTWEQFCSWKRSSASCHHHESAHLSQQWCLSCDLKFGNLSAIRLSGFGLWRRTAQWAPIPFCFVVAMVKYLWDQCKRHQWHSVHFLCNPM